MNGYTIPELEKMLSRIPPHSEASEPAVHLARQLLDTMRRIEAVLAIEPPPSRVENHFIEDFERGYRDSVYSYKRSG